jgi:hypothetical protein
VHGGARLCRADEYGILRCAYRAVRALRSDGIQEEIERELRAGADVAVSRRSSLFLLLIRCALPRLNIRRASKWAAALEYADAQGIRSNRLPASCGGSVEWTGLRVLGLRQFGKTRLVVRNRRTPLGAISTAIQPASSLMP